jgi:hypothetical protein
MKHLNEYISQKNRWNRFFGKPELRIEAINQREAEDLFRSLTNDLSPENLTCDGELRGSALQRKATMLKGAVRDLEWMGYTAPDDAYF